MCAFRRVADPLRHFGDGLKSLLNPIGSIADKLNVGLYRLKSLSGSIDDIYKAPEVTTEAKLIQVRTFISCCLLPWHSAALRHTFVI
jgi:hypothetical protein